MKKIQFLALLLLLSCHITHAQAPQLDSALAYLHDHALFNGTALLAVGGRYV